MSRLMFRSIVNEFRAILEDDSVLGHAEAEIASGPVLCIGGEKRILIGKVRPLILERSYCQSPESVDFNIKVLVGFVSVENDQLLSLIVLGYGLTGELEGVMFRETLP